MAPIFDFARAKDMDYPPFERWLQKVENDYSLVISSIDWDGVRWVMLIHDDMVAALVRVPQFVTPFEAILEACWRHALRKA